MTEPREPRAHRESNESQASPELRPEGGIDFSRLEADVTISGAPKKFFTHPDHPGVLFRREDYADAREAEVSANTSHAILRDYAERGIEIVPYAPVGVDESKGQTDYYTAVEKVEGARALIDVATGGEISDSLASKIDHAGAAMAAQLTDAVRHSGEINAEFASIRQFAVAPPVPTSPNEERLVYVDVEAMNPEAVSRNDGVWATGHDAVMQAAINLAESVAEVKEATGREFPAAEAAIREIFAALPAHEMPEAIRITREEVIHALERVDMETFAGIAMDNEEATTEKGQAWCIYIEDDQMDRSSFVAAFPSDKALELFKATGERVFGELTLEQEEKVREYQEQRGVTGQVLEREESHEPRTPGDSPVLEQGRDQGRDPENPDSGSGGTPAPTPEPPLPTLPTAGVARELEDDRQRALEALQHGLRIGQELADAREIEPGGGNDTSEQSQAQSLERNASDSNWPGAVVEVVEKDAIGTELARVVDPSEPGKTVVVQELADTARGLAQGVELTTQAQVVEVQTGRTPGGEVPVVERSLADQLFELAREAERIGNSAPRIVPTPLQTRSLKDKVLGKIPGLKREAPTHNESLLRHPNQMTQEERQRIIDVRMLEQSGVKDAKARTIARGISLEGPARDVFEAAVQQRAAALLAQNPNHGLGKDAVAERTELARQQVLMGMAIVTKQVQDRADNLALEGRNTALAVEAARNQKNTPTVEQVLNLLNKGRVTPEEQRRHLELEARALVRESPGLGIEQAKELLLEQRRIEMNNAPSRGRGAPGVEKGIDLGRGR